MIFLLLFRTNKRLACAASDLFEIDKFLDKKSAALQIENVSPCNMLDIGTRQWVKYNTWRQPAVLLCHKYTAS
jgi:homoserine acetyltransferase